MKKGALILTVVLALCASVMFADDYWAGTFWGDHSGEWEGVIKDDQDPIRFEGEWVNEEGEEGKLKATGDIDSGFYVFDEGDILDADGGVIGHWSGKFPIFNDAYVTGPWWTADGGRGTWGGSRP